MEIDSELRHSVRKAYSAIAEDPHSSPPFPVGRGLAEGVGYPPGLLNDLPPASVATFCGVSSISLTADIRESQSVLDLGCGAGMDTIILARRVGASGEVIGIDFSAQMLARAEESVRQARLTNVRLLRADAESLPVRDQSIDTAIVNGIFNLNPARERIFDELARVIKPNGAVWAAELVLNEGRTISESSSANWLT